MEKRKKRFWSLILSTVMVIGLLWAVPGDGNAAAVDYSTIWKYTGATGGVIDEDGYVKDEGKYEGGPTCKVTELSELISYDSGIYISGDVTIGNSSMVVDATEAEIEVSNSSVLQCGSFSGRIKNSGIFIIDSFDSSSFSESFYNNGTIKAKNVKLTTMVQNDMSAVYSVSDSFTVSGYNSENIGTVIASPNTKITSDGGGFNLIVNSGNGTEKRVTVSGSVDGVEAWTLFDADSSVTDVSLTIAPADSEGDLHIYGNDRYVKQSFNITPPEGYAIGFDISEYDRNGLNISEERYKSIIEDSDYRFFVLRLSDHAYNFVNPLEACENFDKIHFDNKKPEVSGLKFKADGNEIATPDEGNTIDAKEVEVSFTVTDDNLAEIFYSESDEPLSLSGSSHTETLKFQATKDNNEDNPKECYYIVYDKAGNEVSLGFNMVYVKEDYAATVTMNNGNDVYYGEELDPDYYSTKGTWDGTVSYEYKSKTGSDSTYASQKPTAAGEYTVKAALTGSSVYKDEYPTADFEILRYTYTATAEVTPTLLKDESGNYYYPVSIGRPDDWITTGGDEKDIIVEYKATSAPDTAYSTTCPTTPGMYMVKVTLPETPKYNKAVAQSNSFEVSKAEVKQATLTMLGEITVGDKFAPSLSTDSDGNVTYKYKPASQTAYGDSDTINKDDIIIEAGNYNAIAFIDESDSYLGAKSNEVTFKVKKLNKTIWVSVDDVIVGESVTVNRTSSFDPALDVEVKYEYKGKNEADSAYTTTVPTKPGEYTVRATLTGSNRYEDTTATDDFAIVRKTPTNCSVNVADIKLGGTIEPIVTTDSDGKSKATFEYKKKDDPATAYTDTIPTETGDYSIRATVPETDTFSKIQCEGSFSIGKIDENTAKVEVPDTVVGTDYTPILTTASDGKASTKFEYKGEDEDDSAYTETKPTTPGKYMVRATVPETSNYKEQVCTATFTISEPEDTSEEEEEMQEEDNPKEDKSEAALLTATAKVEIPDVYVGVSYEPLLTTDSDGKERAEFEYKSASDKDAEFSGNKPVKAGKYIIRATVPATEKYNQVVCEGSFTISKNTAKEAKVKIKDVTVGNSYNPVISTDSDGVKDTVFEYKKTDDESSAYSKIKPTKVGKYTVRATVPETEKYLRVVCESTFTIDKKTPEASVKLDDQFVGVKYKPALTTDSDGKSKVYFEYKRKDASDDEYSKIKPVKAGEYEVRATIPETAEYNKATCKTEFSIKYFKENGISYKLTGDSGKGGYYVSDVYIVAPEGYEISTSEDGIYSKRVKYSDEIKHVYLRRIKDGAKTEKIEISQEIKVDKDAPKLLKAVDEKNEAVELSGAKEYYADKLTLSFSDDHLASVRINGENVMPDDKDITLILDPEGGDKYYALIVEDAAGNKYSANFVLKALWMRSNILPSGSKVKLRSGNGYTLNSGSWKVDGDTTVYSGGRTIYVNSDGEYIFVEQ